MMHEDFPGKGRGQMRSGAVPLQHDSAEAASTSLELHPIVALQDAPASDKHVEPYEDETSEGSVLRTIAHRQEPPPTRPWTMRQRWNDLLFAHWPVDPAMIARLLPAGLAVDTFDGNAWLGIVPFGMDQIQLRGLPSVPGTNRFPELNLRTYVRERNTNLGGVYFFSLDAANPLAVAVARMGFHLPYYWAKMRVEHESGPGAKQGLAQETLYTSSRLFTREPVRFRARYRGLGKPAAGPIEQFLTARYSLYTTDRKGGLLRGNIHHKPWPLEQAEAEFERNDLLRPHGLVLPDCAPLLHYSRELVVYLWALDPIAKWQGAAAAATVPSPETA